MNKFILLAAAFILMSGSLQQSYAQTDTRDAGLQSANNPLSTNEIAFAFDNPLDEYDVSGIWFPMEHTYPQTILSGPAVFQLKNRKTGKIIKIAENAISMLNPLYFSEHHIQPNEYQQKQGELIARIKSEGQLHLPYNDNDRAQKMPCANSKDTCLKLGHIPIDLQDINFDGTPELVVDQRGTGQRGDDSYAIFSVDPQDESKELGTVPYNNIRNFAVFRGIDAFSTIDLTKKEIELHASNGACADNGRIYSAKLDPGYFTLIETWFLRQGDDGTCLRDVFRVDKAQNGVPKYELISTTRIQE